MNLVNLLEAWVVLQQADMVGSHVRFQLVL